MSDHGNSSDVRSEADAPEEFEVTTPGAALSGSSIDEIEIDTDYDDPIPFDDADLFLPVTPKKWNGTPPAPQQWLASCRIPSNDVSILTGNGGSGKTEIIVQLLVYVAAALTDWLGCTIENGIALFLSCEEPEDNIRDRIERISRHVNISAHTIADLHLLFPELDATYLVHAERDGLLKTALMNWLETWIAKHRPRLVVIDSVAAVFDADAISRRQVRAFVAMLRKIAKKYDVAIVLLDHPSLRGMADGSGTANSVDWRNSVRSMMVLSEPDKDDPDLRILEFTKNNRGRKDQRVTLRWSGLTFTTEAEAAASPHRVAAERAVDDLFLRLLDKRLAQGRPVHAKSAKGSAPAEFALDPEANGVTAEAFRLAMERLFTAGKVVTVEVGPPSRRREHIERAPE